MDTFAKKLFSFIIIAIFYIFYIKRRIIISRYELNKNLAQMLKGGVIMDVTTLEEAIIAEKAGACAVMALERVPSEY